LKDFYSLAILGRSFLEVDHFYPGRVFKRIVIFTPEKIVAERSLASTLLRIKFHSNKYPRSFWLSAIDFSHGAVVTAIREWITVVVFSASGLTELDEGRNSLIIHSFSPASIFMLCSHGRRPESSVVGGGGEDDWVFVSDGSESIGHPSVW